MKRKLIRFFTGLTLFTLFLGGLSWILDEILPDQAIHPVYPYLLVVFYVVTSAVHLVLLRITLLTPRKFVSYFMLATLVKLILYLTAVLAYVFTYREHVLSFVMTFFILYILFSVFEVVLLLTQTRDMTTKM